MPELGDRAMIRAKEGVPRPQARIAVECELDRKRAEQERREKEAAQARIAAEVQTEIDQLLQEAYVDGDRSRPKSLREMYAAVKPIYTRYLHIVENTDPRWPLSKASDDIMNYVYKKSLSAVKKQLRAAVQNGESLFDVLVDCADFGWGADSARTVTELDIDDFENCCNEWDPEYYLKLSEHLAKRTPKFLIVADDDDDNTAIKRKPLIEGVLSHNAFALLYGSKNTSKTFLAIDIAYRVATGIAWVGHAVDPSAVAIVAAEGDPDELKARLRAWRNHHGNAATGTLHLIPCRGRLDMGSNHKDTDFLIARLKAKGIKLVLIDNVQAVLGANDANGMGMHMVRLNAERIRDQVGCTVVLIHHENAEHGARGNKTLTDAAETVIRVSSKPDGTAGKIEFVHQRDMAKIEPIPFKRVVAKDATSCVIEYEGEPKEGSKVQVEQEENVSVELSDIAAMVVKDGEGDDRERRLPLAHTNQLKPESLSWASWYRTREAMLPKRDDSGVSKRKLVTLDDGRECWLQVRGSGATATVRVSMV
jgi:hypothetical protein